MTYRMRAGYRGGSYPRTQCEPFIKKPPKEFQAIDIDEAFKLARIEWPAAHSWEIVEVTS